MSNNDIILSQIRQRLEILYQMVDELEREGGGGGGGTTNYNQLSNKPSIEGQQLIGNKTAAQLGLATSSALNTVISNFEDLITPDNITVEDNGELPSSINSRLTLHQPIMLNHTVYYFYDESGVDYNYFAVDISGAYPKLSYAQIFKENRRVHFYDFVTDTVPTNNSNNFITSGGIYTALEDKINIMDVFGIGETIPTSSDLNNYTTPGIYRCALSSIAQTLSNCPTTQGFKLEVRTTTAENRLSQVLYANATIPEIYYRTYTTNGWSSWYKLDMTVVQTGS